MKMIFPLIFLLLVMTGCQIPLNTDNSSNNIYLRTDKTVYARTDSIDIIIENDSHSEIFIGLRCGVHPEMFYQQKEGDTWSDNRMFWYMSLLCPTVIETIASNNTFHYAAPSELFESSGTYRLVLTYHKIKEDEEGIAYSQAFEIK